MSRYLNKQLVNETNRGRVDRVEKLLAKGADINRLASDGFTPLMRAAYQGHLDLVRLLLQRNADPNVTADDGASALFWACVCEHESIAEILLDAGADVNAARDGYSVLHAAIDKNGSVALVQSLIMHGVSLQLRYCGRDILQHAEEYGRQDLIPLLNSKRRRRLRRGS